MYPENTLLAFERAKNIKGLVGIELDIQLTKDGEMVVIHDEKVDRTTNGIGYVKDYKLSDLKKLKINAGNGVYEQIPTMEEVMDLLETPMKKGFKLNIELKNSVFRYESMEEKIVSFVEDRNLTGSVVYSSFYAESLQKIRELAPDASLGLLDVKVSDCLYKLKAIGEGANALHPFWRGMDLPKELLQGFTVRAWFGGHLYPEKPTGTRLDLERLEEKGITDVFLNEPERYLGEREHSACIDIDEGK